MRILNLNRLKTLFILIVFSFYSCQKKGKKDSTIRIITLKGYEADKINKVTFFTVLKISTLVNMKIDKILKFTNPKLDDFGSIDIYLRKYILPTKKYKLVLNPNYALDFVMKSKNTEQHADSISKNSTQEDMVINSKKSIKNNSSDKVNLF